MFQLVVGWVGLGQSSDGLGWIRSHKKDPWTTLPRTVANIHVRLSKRRNDKNKE